MLIKLKFLASRDKDVFDLLMSDKVRFSDQNLRKIALERGLICSPLMTRENIALKLSLLIHDHASIVKLIETREHRSSTEKRAFVEFPVGLTRVEALKVVENYKKSVDGFEDVDLQTRRANDLYVNVAYDEIDYSKTRLIQRQRKDAGVEIVLEDQRTVFRMPATPAARDIVRRIGEQLNIVKLANVFPYEISLESLTSVQRTDFFITTINSVTGFPLKSVIGVKISTRHELNSVDEDDGEDATQNEDVLSEINNVALSGSNLIQSDIYRNLKERGFFITAMTWHALQQAAPFDLFQFDVSFDQPLEDKGLKFGVRSAKRLSDGEPSTNFRPLEKNQQPAIWKIIESAFDSAFRSVREKQLADKHSGPSEVVE